MRVAGADVSWDAVPARAGSAGTGGLAGPGASTETAGSVTTGAGTGEDAKDTVVEKRSWVGVVEGWEPGAGAMTSCPPPGVMVLSAGTGRGPTCPGGGSGLVGLE